ncbi:phytase [Membranihabitans maritimus]|uniref:phytase n=1 Tax=Membranihabitans maritimus TaxID=2904244 RepID=UPI001EFFE582|nr:phytase [Membranihabitans maritimus]
MRKFQLITCFLLFGYYFGVAQQNSIPEGVPYSSIEPQIITDTTEWDTDDPAIWINKKNPEKSLVIGTDKNENGALYAFNLKGEIVRTYSGLRRPNNVDITYGFPYQDGVIDIAVVTERLEHRIRVFRLPELEPIDQGNLVVFNGDAERAPMGVALYKRPADSTFFVLVGGKTGPPDKYIGQYQLEESNPGKLSITLVRQFGKFSGKKEIEAIAVDNELGYVYYSDETVGIRKYFADPDGKDADNELALFATKGFRKDHEGISIYKRSDGTGYIIVSDQQANRFWLFPREGTQKSPHDHPPVKIIGAKTIESDGNDVTSFSLPPYFEAGLFVAMSNGKTFHFYNWKDMAEKTLKFKK